MDFIHIDVPPKRMAEVAIHGHFAQGGKIANDRINFEASIGV